MINFKPNAGVLPILRRTSLSARARIVKLKLALTMTINDENRVKIKVYSSVKEVPERDWNQLAVGHSLAHARAMWCALEKSGISPFCDFRHVLLYDEEGRPLGLSSYYTTLTDLAIFSAGWRKWLLQEVRSFFPNFLKVRMLECGNPLILNFPYLTAPKANQAIVAKALMMHLRDIAKKEGHFLIVVRDLSPTHAPVETLLEQFGFTLVKGLPTTFISIQWTSPSDYFSSMRSHYRNKVFKCIRTMETQGVRCELADTFDHHAEELYTQWKIVHENAKEYQRDTLTPEFFRQFARDLGENAKVLLLWREDLLVGHILLMVDGPVLRALFFGRSHPANDGLYIYALYKAIEAAIQLKVKMLELGLTTYAIKTQLGAIMYPQRYALWAPWPGVNPMLRRIYPLLNQIPEIQQKNVFKERNIPTNYLL